MCPPGYFESVIAMLPLWAEALIPEWLGVILCVLIFVYGLLDAQRVAKQAIAETESELSGLLAGDGWQIKHGGGVIGRLPFIYELIPDVSGGLEMLPLAIKQDSSGQRWFFYCNELRRFGRSSCSNAVVYVAQFSSSIDLDIRIFRPSVSRAQAKRCSANGEPMDKKVSNDSVWHVFSRSSTPLTPDYSKIFSFLDAAEYVSEIIGYKNAICVVTYSGLRSPTEDDYRKFYREAVRIEGILLSRASERE
jgi:hypothetical protein